MKNKTPSRIDFKNLTDEQAEAVEFALNAVTEMIEIATQQGDYVFVNKRWEQVTGYTSEEAIGRSPRELVRSDSHDPALFGTIWDDICVGKVWQGEYSSRCKDGTTLHQLVKVGPVGFNGDNADIHHFVGVKQPIDELLEFVANSKASLSQAHSAEYTAMQKRLRAANANLVASASMGIVGQLAAAVGHEVNNPAQVLRSCLEYLAEKRTGVSPKELTEVIEDALIALRKIETVTSELVPFASSSDEEIQVVDLNYCVRRGLRMARTEIQHRAELIENLQDVPSIHGVENRLSQLMTGVLISIVHHLDEEASGNKLVIKTHNDVSYVYVDIECYALGQEKFFTDLKERLGAWETSQMPTSSQWITLILCQQIAVAHGGRLDVTDISDEHAMVSLAIPYSVAEQIPQQIKTKQRVLIVDDEELIARSLKRMLRSHFEVECCYSGIEAIERICEGTYDIAICDIMMPGVSGAVVYDRVGILNPEMQKRIMFISAGTFTEKTRAFADDCKQPVLRKPIRKDTLVDAIVELLKNLE